jgi:hypothetical protein
MWDDTAGNRLIFNEICLILEADECTVEAAKRREFPNYTEGLSSWVLGHPQPAEPPSSKMRF